MLGLRWENLDTNGWTSITEIREKNQVYVLWALGMGNGDGEYFYCYGDVEVNILLHFNENNEVCDLGVEL